MGLGENGASVADGDDDELNLALVLLLSRDGGEGGIFWSSIQDCCRILGLGRTRSLRG